MHTNATTTFGIRMESIGGYGAHVAGRILSEAGVLRQGLGGSNFSSYGSEKKGSPVTAFVRFCPADREVRVSSPIEEPNLIAVFHEALARTHPVTGGLQENGIVILNTRQTLEEARHFLKMTHGTLGVIDAITIAIEEGSRVNMVMLGAMCRAIPFIDPEAVKAGIAETFQRKYAKTIPGNLKAFARGYAEVLFGEVPVQPGFRPRGAQRPSPAYGYMNAPIGGVIVNPGNSIAKDLSPSRQGFLPEFLRDKCIDCAQCEIACPDMCFVWEMGADKRGRPAMELRGIDYQYCKGCMKCVEACPTDALIQRREEKGWAEDHRAVQAVAAVREGAR